MIYETVQLEMRGIVGVITLNRPDALNALTLPMAREFQAAVGEARELRARAMVLTGVNAQRAWKWG